MEQTQILAGLHALGARGRDGAALKNLGPIINHVRKAVGAAAVETVEKAAEGGAPYRLARYKGNFESLSIDAVDFALLCNELLPRIDAVGDELWRAPELLPADFGALPAELGNGTKTDELSMWHEAQKTFPVNPSVQLERFVRAYQVYNEFADHQWPLMRAIALGYTCRFLRDGQESWLARAVASLELPGRDGDIPDDIWMLRFRLVASQASWRVTLDEMCRRYVLATNLNASDEEVSDLLLPDDIADFVGHLRDQDVDFILKPRKEVAPDWVAEIDLDLHVEENAHDRHIDVHTTADLVPSRPIRSATGYSASISDQSTEPSLLEVATRLGITSASSVALRSSKVTPVECCRQVDKRLWFSGIMANKWVLDDQAHKAFDELLTELDGYAEADPLCRLMIVDPNGRAGAKLKKRGMITERELRSIPVLQQLVHKHPSFEVRMYDAMPTFRLIIVDQVFVTVAPYLNVLPGLIPDRGWDVPHLVLKPSAEAPLAHSFITLFEQNWESCSQSPLPMP